MEGGGWLVSWCIGHLAGCTKPMRRLWISSMEDRVIREGFENLRPGQDYDGLHQAALCRQKADWLVGINAPRLFSMLYGRTLDNEGHVTLALIVQREAEIAVFEPVPFYTVELDCGGVTLTGERTDSKEDAAAVVAACEGSAVSVQTLERREKSEKPPALYDLTTLQRDANRVLGYIVQQTLADVVERTGCAVILIGHLNKAAGGQSAYRGLGSIDSRAAARSVLHWACEAGAAASWLSSLCGVALAFYDFFPLGFLSNMFSNSTKFVLYYSDNYCKNVSSLL